MRTRSISFACLAGLLGCAGQGADTDIDSTSQRLSGQEALGSIPAGMPSHVSVGLFEDTGQRWMTSSGVDWDVRYRYFVKGWANNWGWGAHDGSFGLGFLEECDAQGFVPAVQYYQLFGEPGGGEAQTLQKVGDSGTMRAYFEDFKLLMQRVKEFGKPTLILVEADATGLLEQQTQHNPHAYAAVAHTGMPELAGLPNTVAGWGLAFLQVREAVGAHNAILGLHVSAWASGKDIAYFNTSDPLLPEVERVHDFLSPLGLEPNATGTEYDVLVADPLDRDADFYSATSSQDRWWDPSDSASVHSKSFNRYAEWLRLWNVQAGKRWVLWQIPLGNSNHANVFNNGGPREGYRDNRAEYFFADGTAHIEKFADAGVIALLFGAGAAGQAGYQNDYYYDGQLFMQSRAGAIVNAGSVPLSGGQDGNQDGTPDDDGYGDGGVDDGEPVAPLASYDFEGSQHTWQSNGNIVRSLTTSTDRAVSGSRSLRVQLERRSGSSMVFVPAPSTPAGARVELSVWIPEGSSITSLQPFVLQDGSGGWAWTGNWLPASQLTPGSWATVTVDVPANASVPLFQLGLQISKGWSGNGSIYLDAVGW